MFGRYQLINKSFLRSMNKRIKELEELAATYYLHGRMRVVDTEKFAELIVRECCDAADMAYEARCKYPGDYVGEQMGYSEKGGIAAWRTR